MEGEFSINSASTVATSVNGEIVFVGYGISAPAKGLDEYAGAERAGEDRPGPDGFPEGCSVVRWRGKHGARRPRRA